MVNPVIGAAAALVAWQCVIYHEMFAFGENISVLAPHCPILPQANCKQCEVAEELADIFAVSLALRLWLLSVCVSR